LAFHLPEEQVTTFEDHEHLHEVLERVGSARTTLIEWMKTNKAHVKARELTYAKFLSMWVW